MVAQSSTTHLNDIGILAFTSILFSYSTKAFTVVLLLIHVVQVLYKVLKSFWLSVLNRWEDYKPKWLNCLIDCCVFEDGCLRQT